MHDTIRQQLAIFKASYAKLLEMGHVADVGALNINGAVKDVIPNAVGFDVFEGPGVDVLITYNQTNDDWFIAEPLVHFGKYDFVTAANSFQFAPCTFEFKSLMCQLCKRGAVIFVSMCGTSCKTDHSSSPVTKDERRWNLSEFRGFWETDFDTITATTCSGGHSDLIYIGQRK